MSGEPCRAACELNLYISLFLGPASKRKPLERVCMFQVYEQFCARGRGLILRWVLWCGGCGVQRFPIRSNTSW